MHGAAPYQELIDDPTYVQQDTIIQSGHDAKQIREKSGTEEFVEDFTQPTWYRQEGRNTRPVRAWKPNSKYYNKYIKIVTGLLGVMLPSFLVSSELPDTSILQLNSEWYIEPELMALMFATRGPSQ